MDDPSGAFRRFVGVSGASSVAILPTRSAGVMHDFDRVDHAIRGGVRELDGYEEGEAEAPGH